MYPFERFTERAKRVLTGAQEEAQRSRHSYIGTEHLLLGLLTVEDGVAAQVLARLGVQVDSVRASIDAALGKNEMLIGQVIPTSRVKKVIELAFSQAQAMGDPFVDTEHLLLGVLIEGEGITAHLLRDLGASLDTVSTAITTLRSDHPPSTVPERPTAIEIADEAARIAHARGERV